MPNSKLLVSICCLTYNHEKYIRRAFDGFLKQETSFGIEVIVHDDASTDGTTKIVEEYSGKHPNLFRPVYQDKNLYSLGVGIYQIYTRHVFPLARGKYLAICEGDDYWTDPLKLQKQINFMEQNPEYSICFHKVGATGDKVDDFREHEKYFSHFMRDRMDFEISDLIKDNFIPNCSTVYRNTITAFPQLFDACVFPDWPLHFIYAQTGKIRFLDEIMAVHHKHKNGMWEGEQYEDRVRMIYNFYLDLFKLVSPTFYPDIFQALEARSKRNYLSELSKDFKFGYMLGINQENGISKKLQNDLDLIFDSQSWKLANALRIGAERILPPNSSRRKISKPAYQLAKLVYHKFKTFGRKTNDNFKAVSEILNQKKVTNQKWPEDAPLLSVIIPNYNYGKYIAETIESVLNQTFANIEVIVVDGGSTDQETLQVLKEINHPKITVHLRQKRHLVGDNRNYGIERAKGKYICCLDADDLIMPTYLEKALFFLEASHYDVVYPWVQCFGNSTELWKTTVFSFEEMISQGNPVATIAVFRKEAWKKCGPYKDWPIGKEHIPQDWEFWVRLAGHGYRFKSIPESLMLYRVHGGSLTDLCQTTHEMQRKTIRDENIDLYQKKYKKVRIRGKAKTFRVKNPFVNLKNKKSKKRILLALPWMVSGGVDTLFLNVFSMLSKDYEIIILTTDKKAKEEGDNTPRYQKITQQIYHLTNFLEDEKEMNRFISFIVAAKEIDVVLIAGSALIYSCLPVLKTKHPDLKVIDSLFNEIGHIQNNRKYARHIDVNIVENEIVQSLLIEKHKEESRKVRLIHNGINLNNTLVNPDKNAIRAKFGIAPNVFMVAWMGRFSGEKNPQAVLEIAKMSDQKEFVFFMGGNGPMYDEVVLEIKKTFPEKVILAPGFVDTPEILSITDVLILPSLIDGRPNIVLEALAASVPVIASDVGGLPTIIESGFNGYLLKADDYSGFAEKIRYLKSNQKALKKMKVNAREYAVEYLDDKIMHEKYADLYWQLLNSNR